MERNEDWVKSMHDEIDRAKDRDFQFGSHDCCTFAGNVIEEMTGTDPMKHFRSYSDKVESEDMMQDICGEIDIEEAIDHVAEKYNMDPVLEGKYKRGDLVVVPTRRGYAAGICVGRKVAIASRDGGVDFISHRKIKKGYRV